MCNSCFEKRSFAETSHVISHPIQEFCPSQLIVFDKGEIPDFYCDACKKSIGKQSRRYHCLECHDLDLCESCYKSRSRVNNHSDTHKLQYFTYSSGISSLLGLASDIPHSPQPSALPPIPVAAANAAVSVCFKGRQFSAPFAPTMTVSELKASIIKAGSIYTHLNYVHVLFFDKVELKEDWKSVAAYGIVNNSTITCVQYDRCDFLIRSMTKPAHPQRFVLSAKENENAIKHICPKCGGGPFNVGRDGAGRCGAPDCGAVYTAAQYDLTERDWDFPSVLKCSIDPYAVVQVTDNQQGALNYLVHTGWSAVDEIALANKCPCCQGALTQIGSVGRRCVTCGVFYKLRKDVESPFYSVPSHMYNVYDPEMLERYKSGKDPDFAQLLNGCVCVKCFSSLQECPQTCYTSRVCVNCCTVYTLNIDTGLWDADWKSENSVIIQA